MIPLTIHMNMAIVMLPKLAAAKKNKRQEMF